MTLKSRNLCHRQHPLLRSLRITLKGRNLCHSRRSHTRLSRLKMIFKRNSKCARISRCYLRLKLNLKMMIGVLLKSCCKFFINKITKGISKHHNNGETQKRYSVTLKVVAASHLKADLKNFSVQMPLSFESEDKYIEKMIEMMKLNNRDPLGRKLH